MNIFVKSLTNRTIVVSINEDMKVINLKEKIEAVEGIQIEQIKLVYSGKVLVDDKYLKDYNILEESFVNMVLSLRGG